MSTIHMSSNVLNTTSVISGIATVIGSLTVLEATGVVVGIIATSAVAITAVRKNVAETKLANIKLRDLEHRRGVDS